MHARLTSSTQIDTNVPRRAEWNGKLVTGDLSAVPGLLESLGYYLVHTSEAPKPQDGYHAEPHYAYDNDEAPTRIVQSWVEVQGPPHPPRTISKYKLKLAIANAGLLDQFTQLISSVEVAPGYMGDEAFRDAVTLDEDNQKFKDAVAAVKKTLGMTDEQIEAILTASVVD